MIFRLIQREGSLSRTEIANLSELSKAAVSSSVSQLLNKELLIERRQEDYSGVGPKPKPLSINPEGVHFLSIDIGGDQIGYGLGNLAGEITETITTITPSHWNELQSDIVNQVRNCEEWSGVNYEEIDGLSIAVPGVVTQEGTVNYVPNVSGLNNTNPKNELGEIFSVPIFLLNDVNASALGEYGYRKNDFSDLIYIAIGTGVGAGIIIDDKLFRGSSNHAGEIGWFVPELKYLGSSPSETKGNLENIISGPDIVETAKNKLSNTDEDTLVNYNNLTPKTILEQPEGSSVAKEITTTWVNTVALLISNITTIIDPEVVILGGGVSKTGCQYLSRIRGLVEDTTQNAPKLVSSELELKAPLYGATRICIENIDQLLWNHKEGPKN